MGRMQEQNFPFPGSPPASGSSEIPTLSLSLLRARLVKLADNLYQAGNPSSSSADWWASTLERINMALSHLDTLETSELEGEFGKNLLVEPLVPTPNPTIVPSVLFRTRPIPEWEQQWNEETAAGAAKSGNSLQDTKAATIELHNEITQRDEEYLELLEWLEERKFSTRVSEMQE